LERGNSVILTVQECQLAAWVGLLRCLHSLRSNAVESIFQDRGENGDRSDQWTSHIMGATGELATAKFLNVYWPAGINTYKAPDLADFLQVRSRSLAKYELYCRPEDPDDHIFILTHYEDYPRFEIVGWLLGRDVKTLGRTGKPGGYRPAKFVRHDQLRGFDEFPWERLWAWRPEPARRTPVYRVRKGTE
jgi:hypothetical protein